MQICIGAQSVRSRWGWCTLCGRSNRCSGEEEIYFPSTALLTARTHLLLKHKDKEGGKWPAMERVAVRQGFSTLDSSTEWRTRHVKERKFFFSAWQMGKWDIRKSK